MEWFEKANFYNAYDKYVVLRTIATSLLLIDDSYKITPDQEGKLTSGIEIEVNKKEKKFQFNKKGHIDLAKAKQLLARNPRIPVYRDISMQSTETLQLVCTWSLISFPLHSLLLL